MKEIDDEEIDEALYGDPAPEPSKLSKSARVGFVVLGLLMLAAAPWVMTHLGTALWILVALVLIFRRA